MQILFLEVQGDTWESALTKEAIWQYQHCFSMDHTLSAMDIDNQGSMVLGETNPFFIFWFSEFITLFLLSGNNKKQGGQSENFCF